MFSLLKSSFVVGWKNIIQKKYVGESNGYTCTQTSVGTTNGAGPHNVQLFMLSPDGVVLHCLPGFWHPKDLASELRFAQRLLKLWQDPSKTRVEKGRLFAELQLAELKNQSRAMHARSGWQGFDAKNERKRLSQGKKRDTFRVDVTGKYVLNKKGVPMMKGTNVVAHERMAKRPFVPFARFDVYAFVDYGRRYYDNNKKVDGKGSTLLTPRKLVKQRKRQVRQKRKAARTRARRDRQLQRLLRLSEREEL